MIMCVWLWQCRDSEAEYCRSSECSFSYVYGIVQTGSTFRADNPNQSLRLQPSRFQITKHAVEVFESGQKVLNELGASI